MARSLEELLRQISSQAKLFDEPVLSLLCGMAALQARDKSVPFIIGGAKLVGIWDWDLTNDLNHLDPNCAELFGVDAVRAGNGLPNGNYISAIHPDDLTEVASLLAQAQNGGIFEAEYRVIKNDRIRRVFARGFCTLDKSHRPERLPGAIFEKSEDSCIELTPNPSVSISAGPF